MVFELSDRLTELIVENVATVPGKRFISFDGMSAVGKDEAIFEVTKDHLSDVLYPVRVSELRSYLGHTRPWFEFPGENTTDPLVKTLLKVARSHQVLEEAQNDQEHSELLLNRSYITILAKLLESEQKIDIDWLIKCVLRGSYVLAEKAFILGCEPRLAYQRNKKRGKPPRQRRTLKDLIRREKVYKSLSQYIPNVIYVDTSRRKNWKWLVAEAHPKNVHTTIPIEEEAPYDNNFSNRLLAIEKIVSGRKAKIVSFDLLFGGKLGAFGEWSLASRIYYLLKDQGISCEYCEYIPMRHYDIDDNLKLGCDDMIKCYIDAIHGRRKVNSIERAVRENQVLICQGSVLSQLLTGDTPSLQRKIALLKDAYLVPDLPFVIKDPGFTYDLQLVKDLVPSTKVIDFRVYHATCYFLERDDNPLIDKIVDEIKKII